MDEDVKALARGWYGYGQWGAPYWFVGMEPGGDELSANLRMWSALGKAQLLDIQAYREADDRDWFSGASKPQSTWTRLIWLVLAYKGKGTSAESTLDYQRHCLGRAHGENALLELSAISTPTADTDEARRTWFRDERISVIRDRLRTHKPRFVVFYSTASAYAKAWSEIVGGSALAEAAPLTIGETAVVMTAHPQRQRGRRYWLDVAKRLRLASPLA
jgi:hypothetical protein